VSFGRLANGVEPRFSVTASVSPKTGGIEERLVKRKRKGQVKACGALSAGKVI